MRQYKTCAKCRIIERQKKKLKKPLAEETMAYGLRQLQEQQPGSWNDDFLETNDSFEELGRATRVTRHNAQQTHSSLVATAAAAVSAGDAYLMLGYEVDPLSYQYEPQQQYQQYQQYGGGASYAGLQQQQQQQSQSPGPGPGPGPGPVAGSIGVVVGQGPDYLTPGPSTPDYGNNGVGNSSVGGSGAGGAGSIGGGAGVGISKSSSYCDVCEVKIPSGSYNLCDTCVSNPYGLEHVYGNFSDFLQQITPDKNLDVSTLTFIKEVVAAPDFNESLDTSNVNPNNERQFKELVLNSIKQIYLNAVMAAIGFKFTRVLSNLAVSSHTAPTIDPATGKYLYKSTQLVKALFKCKGDDELTGIIPNIQLFVTYNLSTNIIVIKLKRRVEELQMIAQSQIPKAIESEENKGEEAEGEVEIVEEDVNNSVAPSYPIKFINLVDRILKNHNLENTNGESLGYNSNGGSIIYDILISRISEYPEDIQKIIESFGRKDEFVNEFVSFQKFVKTGGKLVNGEVRKSEPEVQDVVESEVDSVNITEGIPNIAREEEEESAETEEAEAVEEEGEEGIVVDQDDNAGSKGNVELSGEIRNENINVDVDVDMNDEKIDVEPKGVDVDPVFGI